MRRHDIKLRRLEREYQKSISRDLLLSLDRFPFDVNLITITKVEIDREMTGARVYFSSSETEINKNNLIAALSRCRNIFVRSVKNAVNVRFYPKIEFVYDEKEDKVNRVLEILHKNKSEEGQENGEVGGSS